MEVVKEEILKCECGATAQARVREISHADHIDRIIVRVEAPLNLQDGSVVCDNCGALVHA